MRLGGRSGVSCHLAHFRQQARAFCIPVFFMRVLIAIDRSFRARGRVGARDRAISVNGLVGSVNGYQF